MHEPHIHRHVVGSLSQQRLQQRPAQEHHENVALQNGTVAGYPGYLSHNLNAARPRAPTPGMSAKLGQYLATGALPPQVTSTLEQHRLHAPYQARTSELNSWVRLLFVSCCITAAILVVFYAFGVIDIDTGPPTRWMDRAYCWVCSFFAIARGADNNTAGAPKTRADMPPLDQSRELRSRVSAHAATQHVTQASGQDGLVRPTATDTSSGILSNAITAGASAAAVATVAGSAAAMVDSQQHSAILGSGEKPNDGVKSPNVAPVATQPVGALPLPSRPLGSKGEDAALAALQRIFGSGFVFTKVRPAWARNVQSGRCLELDLYNEELKLALECDGVQHYVWPNSFHGTRAQFDDQIYRDRLKEEMCRQAAVTLVRIPFTVPLKNYEIYLRGELQRIGFHMPAAMTRRN